MARQLKTYVTNLGFFELAIAAPSMKAALEAWGMSHNAFQHGFAKQTDDPATMAAATAHPGVVLKRAVGSSTAFAETAELPKTLPNIKPPSVAKPARKSPSPTQARPSRSAILSFEKARKKRDKQRAAEDAKSARQLATRKRATGRAQAALEEALAAHERVMGMIEKERTKLDRQAERETGRWQAQREKLELAVERARNS